MPPKRMTANPIKPARYRAGKALAPEDSSSESEDGDEEESKEPEPRAIPPPPKAPSAGKIASNLGKVDLNERRKQAEEQEERRLAREKAERLAAEEGFVTEEEESEADEEQEEEEDGSESEEESSSEEEAPRRMMIRPKFIPKSQRNATKEDATSKGPEKDEETRLAEEEARKNAAADELVEEQIKKDLAARAGGKKYWEDDAEGSDSDVDTTDGLDPEAEEAAWRLRELKRFKRERDAIAEKEAEYAERERRDNLTQEEREAEDADKIAKQQEEKDSKGKMSYMQKYFHKGAFFSDEAKAAGLDKRDIMGSRIADDVRDRSSLPAYLQKRDMTKLGKKGGTKYKDMKTEDTGRWGEFEGGYKGRNQRPGAFDVDDRFRPDDDRGGQGPGGANAIPLGERKGAGVPGAPNGPRGVDRSRGGDRPRDQDRDRDRRDRDGDSDSHRSRDGPRDDHRRRDRSRSRSPRRDSRDDHRNRRKRSTSRYRDRYESDKRRKVDAR